jgi:hypothetical protein
LRVFEKFAGDNPDRRQEPDDMMRRNRELALFEDDFEMRRHADVTLRLQRISTLLIREGSNGLLYEHVLDAAIDLMSADMGSIQVFHPARGELRLLAERGFDPESSMVIPPKRSSANRWPS